MRAIDGYDAKTLPIRAALRLLRLVFVRPGELRLARWEEFDFPKAEWRIPGERMKMRSEHVVPLSSQALVILQELHPVTGPTGCVFPSILHAARPISDNTINSALRRLG